METTDRGISFCRFETPLGMMELRESVRGVTDLGLAEGEAPTDIRGIYLPEAVGQLREYFAGTRREFDVPLDPAGTQFQLRVWEALRRIPWGQTRSYQDIAREIGIPGGARAVGMACHRNPILILIPCHRVVGKNGALTGFASGLERKRFLLKLERGCKTGGNRV